MSRGSENPRALYFFVLVSGAGTRWFQPGPSVENLRETGLYFGLPQYRGSFLL